MTDLWSLTIAFRGPNTSLRLNYNSAEKATVAYEALKRPGLPVDFDRGIAIPTYEPTVEITDSYGTTATVDRDAVMTHWLTHKGSEAEGAKAEQILIAHAQASLQRAIAADPMLKSQFNAGAIHGGSRLNLNG